MSIVVFCSFQMTNASYNVRHDGVSAMSYSPRSPGHQHDATPNGNAYRLPSRNSSTVAVVANGAPCHFSDEWMTDRDGGSRCDTSQKEPSYPVMHQILDLLKDQRSQSSRKARTDKVDDESDLAMVEWQMVAMVTDRVLLAVFIVLVLVTYAIIFGGAPMWYWPTPVGQTRLYHGGWRTGWVCKRIEFWNSK